MGCGMAKLWPVALWIAVGFGIIGLIDWLAYRVVCDLDDKWNLRKEGSDESNDNV